MAQLARSEASRDAARANQLEGILATTTRKAFENTSNSGFLKLSHHDNVDVSKLLVRPAAPLAPTEVTEKMELKPIVTRFIKGDLPSLDQLLQDMFGDVVPDEVEDVLGDLLDDIFGNQPADQPAGGSGGS